MSQENHQFPPEPSVELNAEVGLEKIPTEKKKRFYERILEYIDQPSSRKKTGIIRGSHCAY